jgi:hypothetical protein
MCCRMARRNSSISGADCRHMVGTSVSGHRRNGGACTFVPVPPPFFSVDTRRGAARRQFSAQVRAAPQKNAKISGAVGILRTVAGPSPGHRCPSWAIATEPMQSVCPWSASKWTKNRGWAWFLARGTGHTTAPKPRSSELTHMLDYHRAVGGDGLRVRGAVTPRSATMRRSATAPQLFQYGRTQSESIKLATLRTLDDFLGDSLVERVLGFE